MYDFNWDRLFPYTMWGYFRTQCAMNPFFVFFSGSLRSGSLRARTRWCSFHWWRARHYASRVMGLLTVLESRLTLGVSVFVTMVIIIIIIFFFFLLLIIKCAGTVDGLGEQTDPGSKSVCNHGNHYHHHLRLTSPHHEEWWDCWRSRGADWPLGVRVFVTMVIIIIIFFFFLLLIIKCDGTFDDLGEQTDRGGERVCNHSLLLLILRFPGRSLGLTILGEIFAYVTVFLIQPLR